MGKSFLVMEQYPAFNENHKKKTKSTTRMEAKLAKIGKWGAQAKVELKRQRRLKKKLIDKSRETKRRLKNIESGVKTPEEEYDASNEADCVVCEIGEEKRQQKEDEEEKQKQEGQEEWAKRRKERGRWYIEVTTSSEGDERPWVSFALKRRLELGGHGEVFYNSDGESVLFEDMEAV